MPLYVLRMRDGNCIIADAGNEAEATQRAQSVGATNEAATIRKLGAFVAQFSLSDEGELRSVLLDEATVADLLQHEYPMLAAARAHAYHEFGASETDSNIEPILFDPRARSHAKEWDKRDQTMIGYAVEEERRRLAN
jgi:hypothetical protein